MTVAPYFANPRDRSESGPAAIAAHRFLSAPMSSYPARSAAIASVIRNRCEAQA
jgi:hypothetical protein